MMQETLLGLELVRKAGNTLSYQPGRIPCFVLSVCELCSCEFPQFPHSKGRFCSPRCSAKGTAREGRLENAWNNSCRRQKGLLNHQWKGDNVKMDGLHAWVRKYLKKPDLCQNCYKKEPYDLANKGEYSRDFKQWEWLCRKCHMLKDGRIERSIERLKGIKSI